MTDGPKPSFREADPGLTPIRDLGLSLEGSALEPIIAEFREELRRAGIVRVRPRFYLSTEWGVPDGTVAIAIPFYLARPDLQAIQADRAGFVEGIGRAEILRYLRHEMGHVVNYAYRFHDAPGWTALFGPISAPYPDEYRPEPFSRKYVRHLPGWYAQKHPDEDWAETFAVWMTPDRDWRAEYAGWPIALAKLEYCDRIMDEATNREPLVSADDLDEDVSELAYTIDDFYRDLTPSYGDGPIPDLDSVLRSMFEDLGRPEVAPVDTPRLPASALLRRIEGDLTADVFRWTGCFPERTRPLVRHLAERAERLGQVYPADREPAAIVAVTSLVTTLALNHVARGAFVG
ncbi:putative zinc-binding metallopeptidase [Tundrisphaera sp. TA3]|uniref:putative zinc-binding metallopeptidase n=1 Tax=Tundrisphaera sp. TA3 TaxID=3435775 RepID=UPI003EB97DF3